jgi:hypothetical protein
MNKSHGWLWRGLIAWAFGASFGILIGILGATPASAAVEGSWMSPCVSSGGQHLKRDLYIVGGHHYSTLSVYADAGCFNMIMKLEEYRTYMISGMSQHVQGGEEIDQTAVRSHITVFDANVADLWGGARFCEIVEWRVGVPTEVTGRDCGGHKILKSGDREYDTYLKDAEGKLWLGNRTGGQDGSTPEKRPRSISRGLYFRQL